MRHVAGLWRQAVEPKVSTHKGLSIPYRELSDTSGSLLLLALGVQGGVGGMAVEQAWEGVVLYVGQRRLGLCFFFIPLTASAEESRLAVGHRCRVGAVDRAVRLWGPFADKGRGRTD